MVKQVFQLFKKCGKSYETIKKKKIPLQCPNPNSKNWKYFRCKKIRRSFRINIIRLLKDRQIYFKIMHKILIVTAKIVVESILPLEILPILKSFLCDF